MYNTYFRNTPLWSIHWIVRSIEPSDIRVRLDDEATESQHLERGFRQTRGSNHHLLLSGSTFHNHPNSMYAYTVLTKSPLPKTLKSELVFEFWRPSLSCLRIYKQANSSKDFTLTSCWFDICGLMTADVSNPYSGHGGRKAFHNFSRVLWWRGVWRAWHKSWLLLPIVHHLKAILPVKARKWSSPTWL